MKVAQAVAAEIKARGRTSSDEINPVALVTGASGALGSAIAKRLGKEGFRVVVHFNTGEDRARAVVQQIEDDGGEAFAFKANVTVQEEVDLMVAAIIERWERIDVLVNNAGITRDGPFVNMEANDWLDVINTNLNSAFYCTHAALQYMFKQRFGRVVTISSVIGIMGNKGQANYAAAKAGLLGFTFALAREYGGRNITFNAVAPGYIKAGMAGDLNAELEKFAISLTPQGRFGKEEEVAEAVLYLVGSTFVNGEVLKVDGGLSPG